MNSGELAVCGHSIGIVDIDGRWLLIFFTIQVYLGMFVNNVANLVVQVNKFRL